MQVSDEILEYDEKSGLKWQLIGESILENKDLMSQGFSQKQFSRLFKAFDTGVPEEKYLIHRFRSSGMLTQETI